MPPKHAGLPMHTSSPTTSLDRAALSTAPSTTVPGKAAPTGPTALPPRAYRAWTTASASSTGTPRSASMAETVDLPIPGGR